MIRHIVLFKLQPFESEVAKTEKLNEIKDALDALPAKISEIISLQVGLNANPAEAFDIALTVDVDSLEDLDIYAKHPDHVAVGGIIRPILESRSCVDYII
ncbi:Dabb family protein [Labilibacter marinus]|uniref:Dabb family protein n=1 Tax=Labilibacter marinus TaxID=1477105 RepID=UPI000829FFB4|nr:Dabb family protein [Labilibacter marinus]